MECLCSRKTFGRQAMEGKKDWTKANHSSLQARSHDLVFLPLPKTVGDRIEMHLASSLLLVTCTNPFGFAMSMQPLSLKTTIFSVKELSPQETWQSCGFLNSRSFSMAWVLKPCRRHRTRISSCSCKVLTQPWKSFSKNTQAKTNGRELIAVKNILSNGYNSHTVWQVQETSERITQQLWAQSFASQQNMPWQSSPKKLGWWECKIQFHHPHVDMYALFPSTSANSFCKTQAMSATTRWFYSE